LQPGLSRAAAPQDLWIQDVASKTESRFTSHELEETNPVWSPDGKQIVFRSNRDKGVGNLYLKDADGAAPEKPLLPSGPNRIPTDWSADGQYIVYTEIDPKTRADIWRLPMFGDGKPIPLVQDEFAEQGGRLSPDGRWLVYSSNSDGTTEIYVQPVPSGPRTKVSNTGGFNPRWRGKEIFYVRGNLELMAVETDVGKDGQFKHGEPMSVVHAHVNSYDVSADGKRFLIDGSPSLIGNRSSLVVVVN
jgi:Tol biopolymer transport system component